MQIPWKLKSHAFDVLDRFKADRILYMMQRYVTRRSVVVIKDVHENWAFHRDALSRIERPRVIEFGAGKSLAQNLYLSQFCRHQTLVDLFPMLQLELVDSAARQLNSAIGLPYHPIKSVSDLQAYGITYLAPYDLISNDFAASGFDACISTNTLEHIPKAQIQGIMKQLRRILRPGGLVSAVIDYSDHYAHTDRTISLVEYLRFEEQEYQNYNHRSHFQNRLRHSDHKRLFLEAGFTITEETPLDFVEFPLDKVASHFDRADPTLLATKGLFVLTNS